MGKAVPIIKSNPKKNPLSDNHLEVQRDPLGQTSSTLEALEAHYRKSLFHQKEKVEREIKNVYDSRERNLRADVQALKEEIGQVIKASQKLHHQAEIAVSQEVVNPGIYHINFFSKIKFLIQKVIQSKKNIEESVEWLQAQNQRGKKKGKFWSTFTSNKGGSKFLLSSEHYLTRSAG